jgi:hypothetical protein
MNSRRRAAADTLPQPERSVPRGGTNGSSPAFSSDKFAGHLIGIGVALFLDAMRKVVPLFVLMVAGVLVAGGHFATIPTAAASPAPVVATSAPVPVDPAPPAVDLPPNASSAAPAKRKASVTTKHRVYRCETRPLQMGTVGTTVQVCDWRDG